MGKEFEKRVQKKERKRVDLSPLLSRDRLSQITDKYLQDADIIVLKLSQITVREQVRTKFNDSSLKELSENIKANGLVQPLVVHKEGKNYVLICGERRFRAMNLIKKREAPCYVLTDKTPAELMSIQFSENSSREDLHYIDKAEGIYQYAKETGSSERQVVNSLSVSKSEVHRSMIIGRLSQKIKNAAKKYDTEKYVLLEWSALSLGDEKRDIMDKILKGEITKRSQLKKYLATGHVAQTRTVKKNVSTSLFLKTMKEKSKKLDPKIQKLLNQLVDETEKVIR